MKKVLLLFAFLGILSMQVFAQRTVTGTVTSADDEMGLPGVSVLVKGTTVSTITDLNGAYTLTAPSDATTIVFEFMGMETQEVEITGDVVDAVLESSDIGIDEVVVTALGIEMSRDKSTAAVTTVGSKSLETTGESGVIQGLSAKSSGISVVKNTGDPGAGAYLQIRGQNTITGSNQPLIVIDGVPVINSSRGGGTDGVVQQSRLNDLNPNDIEKVDILKGAAAASLWGTRAANGVIMITTKSGKGNQKGVNVEFSSGFSFDVIGVEVDKQDKFGQGRFGLFVANRGESWGDKISERAGGDDELNETGRYFLAEDGSKYYRIVTKNSQATYNDVNRDQVFRNGFASDINLGINLKSDKSNTYISIGDWNQKGIINGNSDYRRTNFRVNFKSDASEKVKFKLNTSYTKIFSNRVQQGSNLNGLYLGYLRTSPDFDNTDYKGTYYNDAGIPSYNAHRGYRRYLGDAVPAYNNPGWTINEQVNTSDVNRFIISPELQIDMIKGQSLNSTLTARFGNDISFDRRVTFFPVNSAGSSASGSYTDENLTEREHTFDVFARTAHNLGDFNLSWVLGAQYSARIYEYLGGTNSSFINRDDQIYSFANGTSENIDPSNYVSKKYIGAGYLILNLDMFDQLYFEFTGRAEKSNAFDGIIFYPSASLGWVFTKSLLPENNVLSFGKLRTTFGTVGVEPPLYINGIDYVSAGVGSGWGAILDASQFGGALQRSTVQGNPDIVPEKKTEFEVGADLRFLRDMLSLNATYYQNKVEGAIFAVDVPASTGYSSQWENAATMSNKGFELDLSGSIINSKDFNWRISMNFSKNKNMVDDLKEVKSIFLNGFTGTSSRAVEGYALGTLWGGKWERDETGALVLDANGFPGQALEEGVLGDPNPDYRAGLGTTLNFKGIALNVLFETSQGGDMWAGTYGVLNHFGVSEASANEVTPSADILSYDGTVNPAGTLVRGNISNFGAGDVLLDQSWYTSLGGGFGPIGEQYVFDASYIRLREVSLSYSFPKSIIKKLKLTNLNLTLIGRNLALWSDFADKFGTDPETNLTGVSNGRGLDYFNNPSTKSYLVKLTVAF
jgi:TonB-linked SusC/RagA family outer membrane protein